MRSALVIKYPYVLHVDLLHPVQPEYVVRPAGSEAASTIWSRS